MIGSSSFVCIAKCPTQCTAKCIAVRASALPGTVIARCNARCVAQTDKGASTGSARAIQTRRAVSLELHATHQQAVSRVKVVDLRWPSSRRQARYHQHLAERAGMRLPAPFLAVRQRKWRGRAALLDGGTEAEAVLERVREGALIAAAGRGRASAFAPAHHRDLRTPQHGQRLRRARLHIKRASVEGCARQRGMRTSMHSGTPVPLVRMSISASSSIPASSMASHSDTDAPKSLLRPASHSPTRQSTQTFGGGGGGGDGAIKRYDIVVCSVRRKLAELRYGAMGDMRRTAVLL